MRSGCGDVKFVTSFQTAVTVRRGLQTIPYTVNGTVTESAADDVSSFDLRPGSANFVKKKISAGIGLYTMLPIQIKRMGGCCIFLILLVSAHLSVAASGGF